MINNIEIGEHCFGPILRVNEIDLVEHEYEPKPTELLRKEYIQDLIDNLECNSNKLPTNLLEQMLEFYANTNNMEANEAFDSNRCDSCGKYNWLNTYTKIN